MPVDDFKARFDLETLVDAKEIEKDPGRVRRAVAFADKEQQRFAEIKKSLAGQPKPMNGAVRNSKMRS